MGPEPDGRGQAPPLRPEARRWPREQGTSVSAVGAGPVPAPPVQRVRDTTNRPSPLNVVAGPAPAPPVQRVHNHDQPPRPLWT